MKKNFNLKRILAGMGLMLAISSAQAQFAAPSGSTHCTTTQDDCTLGSKVQVTFTINPGSIIPIGALDEYKVEIKLYRGEWTPAGFAFTVTNEVNTNTSVSPVVSSPVDFETPTFFSTGRIYSVSRNGAYRAKTTLLQNTTSNGWVVRYTTPLSSYYAVNDVTHEHYGDWDEVALVENLNVAPYFSYSINGKTSSSPVPNIITCPAVPLKIQNVTGGAHNPGTSTITVQKGTMVGTAFDPGSNPAVPMTFVATNADQDLYSLFPGLSAYTGALKVTYRIPDDVCGSTSTQIAKTMTISVSTAEFLNDYKSRIANNPACPGSSKSIVETVSGIDAIMPTGANLSDFRCSIKARNGWAGAGNVGLNNLTFSVNYAVDVYEVDPSTGIRLLGAPSIFMKNGTTPTTDDFSFNDAGFGAGFNSGDPHFVDLSAPADPNGSTGGGDYFKQYYAYAKSKLGTDPNALIDFSAKVFCAEVSQFPEGGCIVNKKNFFRIAHASFSNAGSARLASSDEGTEESEEYLSLDIYPNPTRGELIIPVTEDDTNVSIRIMDNLGKEIYTSSDIRSGRINIEKLTAGIYFYTIQKNGNVYRGKVVKE